MSTKNRVKTKKTQSRRPLFNWWLVGGIAGLALVLVLVVVVALINNGTVGIPLTIMGDEIPVASATHVATGTDPGPYPTNPPAGGKHYPEDYPAKFYQQGDPETTVVHPEGYLVHSLEHGYVIFWYNCQVAGTDCAALKQQIQKVMDENGGTKLIAFPWPSLDVPLAMTSWGRLMKFTTPDPQVMSRFVKSNRYKAPEPNAD